MTRLAETAERIPPLQDSIRRIWALERERAQLYYQALLMEYDTTGTTTGTMPPVMTNGNGNY